MCKTNTIIKTTGQSIASALNSHRFSPLIIKHIVVYCTLFIGYQQLRISYRTSSFTFGGHIYYFGNNLTVQWGAGATCQATSGKVAQPHTFEQIYALRVGSVALRYDFIYLFILFYFFGGGGNLQVLTIFVFLHCDRVVFAADSKDSFQLVFTILKLGLMHIQIMLVAGFKLIIQIYSMSLQQVSLNSFDRMRCHHFVSELRALSH